MKIAAIIAATIAAGGITVAGLAGCATFQAGRLYTRGSDALARGENERAITDLERAAALAPHASEIQNHLGLAYQAAGRHEEARTAFERAVDLDCNNHAASSNLAASRRMQEGRP